VASSPDAGAIPAAVVAVNILAVLGIGGKETLAEVVAVVSDEEAAL